MINRFIFTNQKKSCFEDIKMPSDVETSPKKSPKKKKNPFSRYPHRNSSFDTSSIRKFLVPQKKTRAKSMENPIDKKSAVNTVSKKLSHLFQRLSPKKSNKQKAHAFHLGNEDSIAKTHLVVLQHGLHGTHEDYAFFQPVLQTALEKYGVDVYVARSNSASFFSTHEGIDTGGIRLADEIQQILYSHQPKIEKLSIIGHSLGGLYSRYCIGVLYARGCFDTITPMNFVTISTPHLGIRRPKRGYFNRIFNSVSPHLFDRTGTQFTLTDTASNYTSSLACDSIPSQVVDADFSYEPECSDFVKFFCQRSAKFCQCTQSSKDEIVVKNEVQSLDIDVDFFWETKYCVLSNYVLTILRKELPANNADGGISEEGDVLHEVDFSTNTIVFEMEIDFSSDKNVVHLSIYGTCSPCEVNGDSRKMKILTMEFSCLHEKKKYSKWLVALARQGVLINKVQSDHVLYSENEINKSGENTNNQRRSEPLLVCLSKGYFLLALKAFKARGLYANVFYDFQVPYTSASIRSHNPHRGDPTQCPLSTIYPHLTLQSLVNAVIMRESINVTHLNENAGRIPEIVRRRSLSPSKRKNNPQGISSLGPRLRGNEILYQHRYEHLDEEVILDDLNVAFRSDSHRDFLRGILARLQTLGWRRIDAIFNGRDMIQAHEHIIGKREGIGIDIAYHIADTFCV